MELLDVKNVRRDDQISQIHTYVEAEIAAREEKLGRQLSDDQRRMYYKPFGIRPGRSILEGVNFDPVFQVFRDPCHLWQGGLLKVLLIPARRHFTGVHICIIKITSTKEERNVHDI